MSRLQTKIRSGIKMWTRIFLPGRVLLGRKKRQSVAFHGTAYCSNTFFTSPTLRCSFPPAFSGRPAIAQVWVPCCIARLFFRFAFRFPKTTLDFILCARFHKNKIAQCEPSGCEKLASFSPRPFDRLTVLRLDCHSYDNETQRRRHFLHLF